MRISPLSLALLGGLGLYVVTRPSSSERSFESMAEKHMADPPALAAMVAESPEDLRRIVHAARDAGRGSIPDLRRLALASPDPAVAGNAIQALGRLGAVVGDPDLVGLLADPRLRVRQEIAVALGESGSPDAVPVLAPLLEKKDPCVRPLVIQALGRIGGEESRRLLDQVVRDPDSTETERVFARAGLEWRKS